jgi:hypothetical protein
MAGSRRKKEPGPDSHRFDALYQGTTSFREAVLVVEILGAVEMGAFDVGGGAVGDGADFSRERLCISLVGPVSISAPMAFEVNIRGIPHLAENERDMGHPWVRGKERTPNNTVSSPAGRQSRWSRLP